MKYALAFGPRAIEPHDRATLEVKYFISAFAPYLHWRYHLSVCKTGPHYPRYELPERDQGNCVVRLLESVLATWL
jgi:hypothetical protein